MFGRKKAVVAGTSDGDDSLAEAAAERAPSNKKTASTPSKPAAKGSGGPRPISAETMSQDQRDGAAESIQKVLVRNDYYRDQYRKAWTMKFVLIGVLCCSMLMNFFQFINVERPLPIAVTPDGRVFAITPLNLDAPLGPNGVAQWSARVLPSLYKLNFTDYREQIGELETMFTPAGYKGYNAALERMQMVELIKNNNYLVHAAPREAPQVVKTGELNGAKMWEVRAPIIVTFDNGTNPATQNLVVTAWIVRVPESANPLGLAIQSFSASRG